MERSVLRAGGAPLQYGSGRCVRCDSWLSGYNPYTTCEPCRRGLITRTVVPKFKERRPIGRGPLLPETYRAD